MKDRLWFYGAAHYVHPQTAAGMFINRNATDPNVWTLDPDPNQPAINDTRNPDTQLPVTWQAAVRP
jgi:hypothetical protein